MYSESTEQKNIVLLQQKKYAALLEYNTDLISAVAEDCARLYNLNVNKEDIEHYCRVGFFMACKAYKPNQCFGLLALFTMQTYIFHQLYSDTILIKIPIKYRIKVQLLYDALLGYINETGTNYFDAVSLAAEKVNMPLSSAYKVLAIWLSIPSKGFVDSTLYLQDAASNFDKWINKNNSGVAISALPQLLLALEAKAKKAFNCSIDTPFIFALNQFEATALENMG